MAKKPGKAKKKGSDAVEITASRLSLTPAKRTGMISIVKRERRHRKAKHKITLAEFDELMGQTVRVVQDALRELQDEWAEIKAKIVADDDTGKATVNGRP